MSSKCLDDLINFLVFYLIIILFCLQVYYTVILNLEEL